MQSPHLKGWCKVGKTTRDPERRAAELSTGLPGRLEVYAECQTNDIHEAERRAHYHLRRWHNGGRDEWFRIDAKEATRIIRKEMSLEAVHIRRQRKIIGIFVGLVIATVIVLLLIA